MCQPHKRRSAINVPAPILALSVLASATPRAGETRETNVLLAGRCGIRRLIYPAQLSTR
jgi:hypothetical protein